jgi:predicted nuclease of predicted toxin-antitoxin system
MKVLADVHIAKKVVRFFKDNNIEAIHVNDILDGSFTKDSAISEFVDANDFVLITKDSDFKDSHFLLKSPKKLIKISLGNILTSQLLEILEDHYSVILEKCNQEKVFIEINHDRLWIIE